VAKRCAGHGLLLASPDADAQRGSQVSLVFDPTSEACGAAYAVVQALIERGVVGDFRAGSPVGSAQDRADILRFGVAPLYTRFVDVWDAAERLGAVLVGGEWRQARHSLRAGVT
jgi:kynureninase